MCRTVTLEQRVMNIFAKLAMVESKMMEGGMRSRRLFCAASVPDLITKQAFADTDAGGET